MRPRKCLNSSAGLDHCTQTRAVFEIAFRPQVSLVEDDTEHWQEAVDEERTGQKQQSNTEAVGKLLRRSSHRFSPDLVLKAGSSMILGTLFEDFIIDTRCMWWPWREANEYSTVADGLIGRAQVAALAACVGTIRNNEALVKQSTVANFEALQRLKGYVANGYTGSLAVVLALVSKGLAGFDLVRCCFAAESAQMIDSVPAWEAHHLGIGAIMQHAGPSAFARGLGASVLVNVIPRLMWYALRERRSTFLNQPEWQYAFQHLHTIPFRATIWPLAVQLPGLLQRLDVTSSAISARRSKSSQLKCLWECQSLCEDIKTLKHKLDAWLAEYTMVSSYATSHDYYQYIQRPCTDESVDKLFPQIQFVDYETAEIYMFYWCYKLMLATTETKIHEIVSNSRLTTEYARQRPMKKSGMEYAVLICQARDYWIESLAIRPETSLEAVENCWSLPLRIAAEWFAMSPAHISELEYCFHAYKSMKYSHAVGFVAEFAIDQAYGCSISRLLEDVKSGWHVDEDRDSICHGDNTD